MLLVFQVLQKFHFFFFLIFCYIFFSVLFLSLLFLHNYLFFALHWWIALHRNDKFCDNICFSNGGEFTRGKKIILISFLLFFSYLVCVWGKVEPNTNGSRNRKLKKMKRIKNISMKILKMSDRFKCITSF